MKSDQGSLQSCQDLNKPISTFFNASSIAANALAYWNYLDVVTLRETGQHNTYAVLAAAATVEAEKQIAMTPEDWNTLGVKLITEDLKVRRDYLDGTNGQARDSAKALNIPADQACPSGRPA